MARNTSVGISHPRLERSVVGIVVALTVALVVGFPPHAAAQSATTNLHVNKYGFSFDNTWTDVCLTIDGTKLRYDPNGLVCSSVLNDGGPWGLCGGMALVAGERFLADVTSSGLTKQQMKPTIVDGQMRTLDANTVLKWLNW